jgi:hypothetical protein
MMECTGSGELFVADLASEVQVLYLENDAISVNGANVLAFSSSIVGSPPRAGPRRRHERWPPRRLTLPTSLSWPSVTVELALRHR